MQVRPATEADAERISSLIQSLSGPFGEGTEQFLASINDQSIRSYIVASNFVYLVAEVEQEIVGVVAMRDNRHLYHLFIAPTYQRQGLGRKLWCLVCESARKAGNDGQFTVNSSPNAVPVYERFGFVPTGPEVHAHGIAFLPMKLVTGENDA